MEADLGSDLVEGPGQEVGGAYPSFEGSERVFDGLSSHPHGLGHAVELVLHPVEHVLMLPALDDPPLVNHFETQALLPSLRGTRDRDLERRGDDDQSLR